MIYQFYSLFQLASLSYIQFCIYVAGGDILQAGLDPDFLPVGKFLTIIDFTIASSNEIIKMISNFIKHDNELVDIEYISQSR